MVLFDARALLLVRGAFRGLQGSMRYQFRGYPAVLMRHKVP